MPDAGDFDRNKTRSWSDAFAALPQEAPDNGGWQRVQARLPSPATRPRTRWPLWLATAATLALVVLIPLRMLRQAEPALAPTPQAVAAAATPSTVTAIAPITPPPSIASAAQTVSTPVANRDRPRRASQPSPSQRPIRSAEQPTDASRVAGTDTPGTSMSIDMEPLYAQSAQLESLLAMARDDRVASGTSAALSDELDGRVAAIDATLIQPGLSDAQRANLWGQRVDTLQQLVGIETTNRLYAARGQTYDAALVSID
ncbi:hypothetical protein [Thermomonas sp. HDW16]|uniref:hypothetical protein n=1 Tax=Thermomonas sp. HDW16 TaxID=2714945 RepID=UPI00140E2534|nr:hypothetical protein [Thermomonas sp. HDW16]QIL19961.1 hypothetical protein G7079_04015 [Thermomonas sp. HDW16]